MASQPALVLFAEHFQRQMVSLELVLQSEHTTPPLRWTRIKPSVTRTKNV